MWSKTILVSHEAESREVLVDFATYIIFEEVVLGSQGTFIASHTTFTSWCVAKLVFAETVIGSRRACLASHEAVIGSQGTFLVSTETYFQEVAIGALAILTFLCLRTCGGLMLPQREVVQTSLTQSE